MHHSGVVMRESTVETATHLLAKAESPPYFSARTAVTPPMGMAASTTETPVTRLSAPQSLASQQHRRRDEPQPDEAVEEAVLIPEFAHPAAADDGTDQDHGNTHVAIAQALDSAAQKPGSGS